MGVSSDKMMWACPATKGCGRVQRQHDERLVAATTNRSKAVKRTWFMDSSCFIWRISINTNDKSPSWALYILVSGFAVEWNSAVVGTPPPGGFQDRAWLHAEIKSLLKLTLNTSVQSHSAIISISPQLFIRLSPIGFGCEDQGAVPVTSSWRSGMSSG